MSLKGVPLAAMERLLKKEGANRVSEEAKHALKKSLEDYASKLSYSAVKYANHAGRKTIKKQDVELATKV
jgi:histone H3/H4